MRFYNRKTFHIKQQCACFYSMVQNHFRWNFSKRGSRGEQKLSCWTEPIRNNQVRLQIKITSTALKTSFKKSEIPYRPSQSINVPIKPPFHPSSLTRRSASGQSKRPGGAPGPGRSEDQARQDETILHDWHGTKQVVLLSCQKMRIPLVCEGKISLAMKNQTIQRMKIDFAEGWQTRGT